MRSSQTRYPAATAVSRPAFGETRVLWRVGRLFAEFRSALPDRHEEIVQLVAEGDTVAGRFRCSGTHLDKFLGEAPTGKRIEWMRSSSCGRRAAGSRSSGGGRTALAGCSSWASCRLEAVLLSPPTPEVPRTLLSRTRVHRSRCAPVLRLTHQDMLFYTENNNS